MQKKLDDLNRAERYFTSTLLGGLLFHNNLQGVKEFLTWLINKKNISLNVVGNHNAKIPTKLPLNNPKHIEVNTEFNIK